MRLEKTTRVVVFVPRGPGIELECLRLARRDVVAHGSKPPEEARASLELFAAEVLPAVHEMDTPLHPHSLGDPEALEHQGSMGGAIG